VNFGQMLERLAANRYEAAAAILFVIGFAGLVFHRNLFKKVICMGFMDDAIFIYLTSYGYIHGKLAPILEDPAVPAVLEEYSSPLPTGLVLTGIVVSVSFTAFSLALTLRLYKTYHSLNIDEIMMQARKSED